MGQPLGPQGPRSGASRRQTRGTETSQYPEEEKETSTPSVAASERGPAQTARGTPGGVVGPDAAATYPSRTVLERSTTAGESPVGEGGTDWSGT